MKKLTSACLGFFLGGLLCMLYNIHLYMKINEKTGIKSDKNSIKWTIKDTSLTIKGDTSECIKMLIKRIDYLENGQPLMRKTHEMNKIKSF